MQSRNRYWTQRELDMLIDLAAQNVSTKEIARALDRTPLAIRIKASRLNLPLTEYGDRHFVGIGGRPPRVRSPRVAANFDLSGLTHQERILLFTRLIEETPGLADAAPEIIAQARKERALVYDASAAATARNEKRVAEWRANREKLGWLKKQAPQPPPTLHGKGKPKDR